MKYGGNLKGTAAILFPMGLRWGAFTDLIFFLKINTCPNWPMGDDLGIGD